jgi:hypothetical protein
MKGHKMEKFCWQTIFKVDVDLGKERGKGWNYVIIELSDLKYEVSLNIRDSLVSCIGIFNNLKTAKQAALKDYQNRINPRKG